MCTHLGLALTAFVARLLGAPVLEGGGGAEEEACACRPRKGASPVAVVLRTPWHIVGDEVPTVLGGILERIARELVGGSMWRRRLGWRRPARRRVRIMRPRGAVLKHDCEAVIGRIAMEVGSHVELSVA